MKAPFTPKQVEALNRWQQRGDVHPFTCPGDRGALCIDRELNATPEGWVCQCGAYTQDWAHDFMANPNGT
jgi:hypothetical protein